MFDARVDEHRNTLQCCWRYTIIVFHLSYLGYDLHPLFCLISLLHYLLIPFRVSVVQQVTQYCLLTGDFSSQYLRIVVLYLSVYHFETEASRIESYTLYLGLILPSYCLFIIIQLHQYYQSISIPRLSYYLSSHRKICNTLQMYQYWLLQ